MTDEEKKAETEINLNLFIPNYSAALIGYQELSKLMTRIKLYEMVLEVQGAVIECGVYKGASFFPLVHCGVLYEPFALNRQIIGFDTFEGFRSFTDKDKGSREHNEEVKADIDEDQIRALLDYHSRSLSASQHGRVFLFKGDVCETIPEFVKTNESLKIALLILDMDLYEPTLRSLENLYPKMNKGGIVAIDDLGSNVYPGVSDAFNEFFGDNKIALKRFPFEPWLSYWIVD